MNLQKKESILKPLDDIFERAKINPVKHETYEFTIKVSDKRIYAKTTRKLKDQSFGPYLPVCGVCGSLNTIKIFYERTLSQEPYWIQEFHCQSCLNYTAYKWNGY